MRQRSAIMVALSLKTQGSHMKFNIGNLSLKDITAYYRNPQPIQINTSTQQWIQLAHEFVLDTLARDIPVYGVNTGFGKLANKAIAKSDLNQLQYNLIVSHACGVGALLSPETASLILLLKINTLAQGYSGVSESTFNAVLALYNHQIWPCIPGQGSVGASGDLAPLAHMSLPLLGEGDVWYQGEKMPAKTALKRCDLSVMALHPKEGLALLNGTQVSTAMALEGLIWAEALLKTAMVAGALSVDAVQGSDTPFHEKLNCLRGHPGQRFVAEQLRLLLEDSEIRLTHQHCIRIQDPYSIRCQPQVLGACWDQWQYAKAVLIREANGISDNPLIFPDDQMILSGGNFHAQSTGMAADALAVVISEIGAISERRVALMMDPNYSGLPAFLVPEPGLNSGLMILQYTAAALASENKSLCFPTSADSIPTSNNQEDHVSMATHGARRLKQMAQNTAHILAIEMICACQGIDFHEPLKTASGLISAYEWVREVIPFIRVDRQSSELIEKLAKDILMGKLNALVSDFECTV